MVTKDSTAHLLPDAWKAEARELAARTIGPDMTLNERTDAILDLMDRCIKEAVLVNMATLLDDTEAADMLLRMQQR